MLNIGKMAIWLCHSRSDGHCTGFQLIFVEALAEGCLKSTNTYSNYSTCHLVACGGTQSPKISQILIKTTPHATEFHMEALNLPNLYGQRMIHQGEKL